MQVKISQTWKLLLLLADYHAGGGYVPIAQTRLVCPLDALSHRVPPYFATTQPQPASSLPGSPSPPDRSAVSTPPTQQQQEHQQQQQQQPPPHHYSTYDMQRYAAAVCTPPNPP
ncbi:hypothetical protein B0H16DRAFT_1738411 [Mycena metata]|uniref:Uncharacterized protein n=1 Tax=Mycena metata TaxID=1033252 RepID=A0AAD7MK60_9AGAR|nr:hypothetical protein B0H16DRAFT_1738411 [Mycena metata]